MIPYNFGLEGYAGIILYSTMWVALLLTMFKDPIYGLYYLTPVIPIQTIRYRLNEYPLGEHVIALLVAAMLIGLLRRRLRFPPTPWKGLLRVYLAFTFVSLCFGAGYLNENLMDSPRLAEWRDYVTMVCLLFLAAATVRTRKQMLTVLLLMCLAGYLLDKSFWGTVSGRDFSAYSDDLRDEGAMGYAGVNGLAAFEAEFSCVLLVLAAFETSLRRKLLYYSLAFFSVVCLTYSLSRAGYAAFVVGFLFVAFVQNRKLLLVAALFALTWAAILPPAVTERVAMTDQGGELDHSSETRVTLWEDAIQVFETSPLIGTGFGTYAYMGRLGAYRDTHNIFVKVLVETGVVGIALFLWLLYRLWAAGIWLYRNSEEPLFRALGLGLAVWIVCAIPANFFGDRWTFLQVNGYMWIIAGLVARARFIEDEPEGNEENAEELEAEAETAELVPAT